MSSHVPGQHLRCSIAFLTDNERETKSLVDALVREAFSVHLLTSKEEAFNRNLIKDADLLIIDSSRFSLEEISSYPRLRTVYGGLLMLLTNGIDEMMQVLLYEQGIDDLLVKPMHHLLILARIRALLRRNGQRAVPATLLFNGLEINGGLRRASYLGEEIPFTSREFDLLCHLAQNAYTTLDRDHLYKAVFGIEYNGYDRSIDMYIARIRAKMVRFPALAHMIRTVRGTGYLFAGE
ncbi:response regulator transcription factor [Desulfobulbus elongatus]|uniref:response regulator transcription factor n=1 Tax=Desulfobulbus elongatus TaxID=53332 RepID=UPI000683F2DF|nr:response regulator transcription factor [Desulfobulbus elongatus]